MRRCPIVALPVCLFAILAGCAMPQGVPPRPTSPGPTPPVAGTTDGTEGAFLVGPGAKPGSCLYTRADDQFSKTFEAPC